MNIHWWTFSEEIIKYEHNVPGVYMLGTENEAVIYIGGSEAIRQRLLEHLNEPGDSCVKRHAKRYLVEYTGDYKSRVQQLIEERVRIYGRPPICNGIEP